MDNTTTNPDAFENAFRAHIERFAETGFGIEELKDIAFTWQQTYKWDKFESLKDEIVSQIFDQFTPEDENGWPLLHPKALHGLPGDIARACTEGSEIDPAAVLTTTLSLAGAMYGRGIHVPIGNQRHHPRLFACIVGKSGRARKGMSYDPVELVLKQGERRNTQSSRAKKYPFGETLNITNGPLSSGEGLIYAIRDESEKKDKDNNPLHSGVNDKRLFCNEAEFGSVLNMDKRQGNSLSVIIRNAWDGKTLHPLTKNSPIKSTDPHICILGHITEQELKSLLTQVSVWNGFANRFMWVCARRQGKQALPPTISDDVLLDLSVRFAETLEHAESRQVLNFSERAREYWVEAYDTLSDDHDGAFGAITSRAEAHTIRLALVYAIFDCANSIEYKHLDAALKFWKYCEVSARYLFGLASTNPKENQLLTFIRTNSASRDDIVRFFNNHATKAEIDGMIENLKQQNQIRETKRETGGRPKTVFDPVM